MIGYSTAVGRYYFRIFAKDYFIFSTGPSMTGIDCAMKRRYTGMEYSVGDCAGPSTAMHTGD